MLSEHAQDPRGPEADGCSQSLIIHLPTAPHRPSLPPSSSAFLALGRQQGKEGGQQAGQPAERGGLWAQGDVLGTGSKEHAFVWEKGPGSGASCFSSDSAISQRGCSSSLDLCFAACEMGVILIYSSQGEG